MKCGLLGQHLRHSYSPLIHAQLGEYEYELIEKEPSDLAFFLRHCDHTGLNVTIPYKKAVLPYLDKLTNVAQTLGAVNTIVRQEDGTLLGHNSDYFGFYTLVQKSGLSIAGKKCLILGSGGACATVTAVLQQMNATVVVISRHGENNYSNLSLHRDACIIVNTTPVGMYPHCGASPVDLSLFPHLEGVLDLIYNPARTQLLLDAERRGIVAMNGLWMLVAQAKESAEYFTAQPISDDILEHIHTNIQRRMENIVLIGMPGCGKSTIGASLSQELGRPLIDIDLEIEKIAQKSIPNIFAQEGEGVFRQLERAALQQFGKESGLVIATGGGCVINPENYHFLHQNGRIIYIKREISKLPTEGRPLSVDLNSMWIQRAPLYESFADQVLDNNGTLEETLAHFLEEYP